MHIYSSIWLGCLTRTFVKPLSDRQTHNTVIIENRLSRTLLSEILTVFIASYEKDR